MSPFDRFQAKSPTDRNMPATQHPPRELTRRPSLLIPTIIIGLLFALRCLAIFRVEVDSDEPQHLHMIYGWVGGELPYRDRFDNHTPLLYILFRPLAILAGETPQIVLLARLAEFPIGLAILGLIYLIARRFADEELALWTVATTLAFGDWSLKSIEFRPDVLWACLWFLAVFILATAKPADSKKFFFAGFVLGLALCASIKTTFLVPALIVGWVGAWLLCPDLRKAVSIPRAAYCALAGGAGFLLAPSALFAWFLAQGTSIDTLKYCLFDANRAGFELNKVLMTPPLVAITFWLAWRMVRKGFEGVAVATFVSVSVFAVALIGFSPELRKQTLLPVYPLFILFGWKLAADALRRRGPRAIQKAGLTVCGLATIHLAVEGRLWEDGLRDQRELLRDTLELTRPGDFLMDRKGETIFRKRPVYLVYQHATVRAIEEGRIADSDPAELTRTGTAVAIAESMGLTEPMRKFLGKNYLPTGSGKLRVAGRSVLFYEENGRLAARAPIYIPGDYVILGGDRVLSETHVEQPGWHDVDLGSATGPATFFWRRAWEAGFRPVEEGK